MPITKINFSPGSREALFSLLQDRNESVASLAMEQILQSNDFDRLMRNYQDSPEDLVRKRVHQMGNIARRRQLLEHFLGRVQNGSFDLWQAMVMIDHLYDPQSSFNYLSEMTNELIRGFSQKRGGVTAMSKFMKEHNFLAPTQNWFEIGNYLLGDVLESRIGAAPLLCIIAQHVGTFRDWQSRICLHNGRFCLLDQNNVLIDPSEDWSIKKKISAEQYHACHNKETLLVVLSQLFSMAVINWEPWDIHLFTKILSALYQIDPGQLPYPLGNYLSPTRKYPEISEQ
jgi:hypothetical protein